MKQEAIKEIQEVNRSKPWQLFLFSLNNGATNCYFILTMNYIAYYANGVLGLTLIFATTMVTIMRIFDGITDPIIGALIDRTETRFGKFRPFMVLGNLILAVSAILIYFATRLIPDDMNLLKYICYTIFYTLFIFGYTFQTACTRSGQTCITNDPKQRPMFNIFNTVASLVGMGLIQVVASIWGGEVGYGTTTFFNLIVPLAVVISIILTALAVLGISQKDNPKYYGMGAGRQNKVKIKDYLEILKHNRNLKMLIVAGSGSKLASSVAQNTTVGVMLFAIMMNDYVGLYLPFYALGFVGTIPFFIINLKISQKYGQKRAMVTCNAIALAMYTGVLMLLLLWEPGNQSTMISFTNINVYSIAFLAFYMIGFGSFYTTADMAIPMVADCSDYEIYRSGNYVPGMVGTLFSLADKMVSSFSTTIVGLVVLVVLGLDTLPDTTSGYLEGINIVVIILFCGLPMLSWVLSLISMKFYTLSGEKMVEIQKINATRRKAIEEGMTLEQAMEAFPSSK